MEFKLIADSAPQEIKLKFLKTVSNSNGDWETGQKIGRASRWVPHLRKCFLWITSAYVDFLPKKKG